MTKNPTPETDKAERMAYAQEHMVPTEFARRLERERDEAREKLNTNFEEISNKLVVAIRERDEARDRAAKLAAQLLTEMEGGK